jgi:Branched-chain amino acid ATP-binding cassette transporter
LKTGTPEQIENDAQVQAIYMGNHAGAYAGRAH